jgi:hypothetical protein
MSSARRNAPMRHQLVFLGLGASAFLLFASISATMAAPRKTSFLQCTSESEPNDDFSTADPVSGSCVVGNVASTPVTETIDYFVMATTVGCSYQANLIIDSPDGLSLRMVLFDGDQGYLDTSTASSTSTSLSWAAIKTSYYIRVEAVTVSTTTVKAASYCLDLYPIPPTPTPTNTPFPGADAYEHNDCYASAYIFPVAASASATDANFVLGIDPDCTGPAPTCDEDWYAFYVKSGRHYRAFTSNLVNVDTYMELYDKNGIRVTSDDDSGGGFASKIRWMSSYHGYYYIRVINLATTIGIYDLIVEQIDAYPIYLPVVLKNH